MFWNILSVENTKILKRRMLWIELGILAVLVVILYTIIYVTLQANAQQDITSQARQEMLQIVTWPGAIINALSFGGGNSLGGLLVIVLVGAVTAQEYTWRTMHLWLSRGVARPMLMGAKFVALLVPIGMFVVTPLIVGGGVTAIFTLHIDKGLPFGQINFWKLGMSALRTAYTLLPYAALTFLLAIISRSTAAAIGVGLAYTLLIEGIAGSIFTLLGGILRQIVLYLPGSLAAGLLRLNESAFAAQVVTTGNTSATITRLAPIPSAIGIALWTAGFLGLAILAFRRQDLSE